MPDIYAVKLFPAGQPERTYYCTGYRACWWRLRIKMFGVRHQLYDKNDKPLRVTREGDIKVAGIPWTVQKTNTPDWWE